MYMNIHMCLRYTGSHIGYTETRNLVNTQTKNIVVSIEVIVELSKVP